MNIKEQKEKLINIKKLLNEYLLKNMDSNKKIKEHFNKYFNYCTFEIFYYYKDEDFEYLKFELTALTTGNIFSYKYDIKNDEYTLDEEPVIFTAKEYNFNVSEDVPKEIIKEIFTVARENEIFYEAEKEITQKIIKLKNIQ